MRKNFKPLSIILSVLIILSFSFPVSINANPVEDPPFTQVNSEIIINTLDEDSYDGTTDEPVLVQPSLQYCTHLEGIGWNEWVLSDAISGTVGEGRRMEAVGIALTKSDFNLDIQYQSFVENFGWLSIRSNGQGSGTSGYGLRLEAIHIELTGADADLFDVYYQVHAQNIGWMDWAKNGEYAGTCDMGLRLEAIRIVIQPAGTEAPGETVTPFIQG
ncbi:hypothetical protein Q5O14_07290 [Eubacteriaceae bacterium ES2]|nr:hypothetical protein Q5O14_07290 [Eubacteriaceae bacterium ES2]